MKKIILFSTILLSGYAGFSQVGIGTTNPQNTFHIDGATNNPSTGTPTTAQQTDDFIVTNQGRVGIGVNQPTDKLDIAGGNVRIRDINTNNGNRTTDSRVVADAAGVLKTVANQTANLVGNTFTDNVPESDWITVNQTNSNIGISLNTYTFTITQTSLVIMNYSVSFALQAPIEPDGRLKRVTNSIVFTNVPTDSNVVPNKSFAFQTHAFSSSASGLPGQYFNAAGESMILTPGVYTISLNGGVAVTNVVNNSLTVKFGLGINDSFTLNAIAL